MAVTCPHFLCQGVTSLLLHPFVVRARRHAENMHTPCFQVDEERNVNIDPATYRQNRLRGEVACPERRRVAVQEVRPRVVRVTDWLRLEAILPKDRIDRRPANVLVTALWSKRYA